MPSLVSVIREWTLIDPWIEAYLASLWPCRKRTAHVFDSLGSISPLGALSLRRSPFHWKGYEGIKGCITCYSSTQIHKLEASCRKQGPLHWQSKTSWTWVNAKSSYLYIYTHIYTDYSIYTLHNLYNNLIIVLILICPVLFPSFLWRARNSGVTPQVSGIIRPLWIMTAISMFLVDDDDDDDDVDVDVDVDADDVVMMMIIIIIIDTPKYCSSIARWFPRIIRLWFTIHGYG